MSTARIEVATSPPYEVVVGRDATADLERLAAGRRTGVLADGGVVRLHADLLAPLGDAPRLTLAPGEGSKSLEVLATALDFLVSAGLDRTSLVVTFGGGVTSDLGGLAASLFLRGVDVVHVPTTLLAQCDAAIGGKTAVNLAAGKNLAGTFHQPRAVLADPRPLATLPPTELRSGLGEALKTAVIGDEELLARLEGLDAPPEPRDEVLLADVVLRCAAVKARVVAGDEREGGERAKLNLGHTFAHGIEHAAGYGTVPHGEAVGVGVLLAARAAERVGRLRDAQLPARVEETLGRLGLATSLAELRDRAGVALAPDELVTAMSHDKKVRAGTPRFVLPRAAGDVEVGVELDPALVRELLA